MYEIEGDLVRRLRDGRISRREFIVQAAAGGASILMIATGLASCSPAPAAPQTSVSTVPTTASGAKLSIAPGSKITAKLRAAFIPEANEVLAALIKDWSAKTGVPVEADIVSMNDLQTIAATAAETGAGPDIVEINVNTPLLYAEKLVDVSDVANDLGSRYGGWYDLAKDANFDGQRWVGIPRFYAAHNLVYREDLFKQVGYEKPPKTWDELLDAGKKLKAAKLPRVGFPLGHAVGDGNNFTYSLLWSFGGREVDKDGKTVKINSPETAKAIDFLRTLFNDAMGPEVLSWDDAANNRAYLAGEVAMTNNASSIYVTAKNQNADLAAKTNHSLYPEGPAGRTTYTELMSQILFKYTKNPDAAKAFLKAINEKDAMAPWCQAGAAFLVPLLKDYEAMTTMPWNTNPKLASFRDAGKYGRLPGYPGPSGRAAAEAFSKRIVVDMFAKAAQGMPTAEAMAWAETQLKGIYGRV